MSATTEDSSGLRVNAASDSRLTCDTDCGKEERSQEHHCKQSNDQINHNSSTQPSTPLIDHNQPITNRSSTADQEIDKPNTTATSNDIDTNNNKQTLISNNPPPVDDMILETTDDNNNNSLLVDSNQSQTQPSSSTSAATATSTTNSSSNAPTTDQINTEKNTLNYLQELFFDRQLLETAPPGLFIHLQRLLDREITRVRSSLIHIDGSAEQRQPLILPDPEPDAQIIQKSVRVRIPSDKYPEHNFIGRIIGPRGLTIRELEIDCGCKILIRGKGSLRDQEKEQKLINNPQWAHLQEELHVLINAEDTANRIDIKLNYAKEQIQKVIDSVISQKDDFKWRQLAELAILKDTYKFQNKNKPATTTATPTIATVTNNVGLPSLATMLGAGYNMFDLIHKSPQLIDQAAAVAMATGSAITKAPNNKSSPVGAGGAPTNASSASSTPNSSSSSPTSSTIAAAAAAAAEAALFLQMAHPHPHNPFLAHTAVASSPQPAPIPAPSLQPTAYATGFYPNSGIAPTLSTTNPFVATNAAATISPFLLNAYQPHLNKQMNQMNRYHPYKK